MTALTTHKIRSTDAVSVGRTSGENRKSRKLNNMEGSNPPIVQGMPVRSQHHVSKREREPQ
jgi:hypothetical protein